jgi:stage IV sporulation protein B
MKNSIKIKGRGRLAVLALLLCAAALFLTYNTVIPDSLSCYSGDRLPAYFGAVPDTGDTSLTCSADGGIATYRAQYKLFGAIPVKNVEVDVVPRISLCPGGMPFGVKFFTDGVMVVGFADMPAGQKNPSSAAGIHVCDVITAVNGKKITTAAELTAAVESCGGNMLTLTFKRGDSERSVRLTPYFSHSEGKYKTGVFVRDSGAGIGTVTYIVPETGEFAGLGHGICDSETGALIPIGRGIVSGVVINDVVRGNAGAPGELKGYFKPGKTGSMISNTDCGVYGVFTPCPTDIKPIPIGLKGELREGEAHILCTLDEGGTIGKYSVSISNINRSAQAGKCFTVKITDPALLSKTGGIVQGMSGSPIIQNGKLVGAVTHVLINDPTTGYGIFIENMLNAAQMPIAKAS